MPPQAGPDSSEDDDEAQHQTQEHESWLLAVNVEKGIREDDSSGDKANSPQPSAIELVRRVHRCLTSALWRAAEGAKRRSAGVAHRRAVKWQHVLKGRDAARGCLGMSGLA